MRRRVPLLAGRVVRVAYIQIPQIPDVGGSALAGLAQRLPVADRERADRFRHDADRARFVFGRLLLRDLTARAVGLGVDAFRIDTEASGRPVVTGVQRAPQVSLSHSGRWVVAALGWRPVGVDVEQLIDEPQPDGVLRRVCSPDELALLQRLPPGERVPAFLRVWTRKEAYGKACGVGMGFALRDITVGLCGSRVSGTRQRWWVTNLDLGPGCAAALAVRGGGARLQLEAVEPALL